MVYQYCYHVHAKEYYTAEDYMIKTIHKFTHPFPLHTGDYIVVKGHERYVSRVVVGIKKIDIFV